MLRGQRGCPSPWVLLLPEGGGVEVGSSPGSWGWDVSEVLKFPRGQWEQKAAGRTCWSLGTGR